MGKTSRTELLLLFAGLSLFLATVELMIPKPMPFLKLGIANLPILLFIRQLRYKELLFLVFLKVFCQALISGTLLSYIVVFSSCASFFSATAMYLLGRVSERHISLLGISVLGAAASNAVQLVLALNYFFPGTGSLLIPWSLSFGLGSGFLLGLFALQFCRASTWYKDALDFLNGFSPSAETGSPTKGFCGKEGFQANNPAAKNALLRFVFGFLSLAIMFIVNRLESLYILFQLSLFLFLNYALLSYRPWWRSMFILLVMLLFFHLLLPSGRVLWEWNGILQITQGALERGLGKAFFLLGLIQVSRFAVSRELALPGRLGHIVHRVFAHYEGFLNSPVRFRPRQPFLSLDQMLCSHTSVPAAIREHFVGRFMLLGALLLQVAVLALAYYLPLYAW